MQSDSKLTHTKPIYFTICHFLSVFANICFCKQNAIKSIFFLTNRRTFAAVNEQSVTKK